MGKAVEQRKVRKNVKDLPARPSRKATGAQVKGGQVSTSRVDPYKNFKF